MNIDEFKYLIMKQFKDEDSAIRDLMLPINRQLNFKDHKYLDSIVMVSHQFDTVVFVESIKDDNDEYTFTISFMNLLDYPNPEDIDDEAFYIDGKTDVIPNLHREVIMPGENTIIFGLDTYSVRVNDYQFSRIDAESLDSIYFDINKGEFVNRESTLKMFKTYIEHSCWTENYAGQAIDKQLFGKLLDGIDANGGLSIQESTKIIKCFTVEPTAFVKGGGVLPIEYMGSTGLMCHVIYNLMYGFEENKTI